LCTEILFFVFDFLRRPLQKEEKELTRFLKIDLCRFVVVAIVFFFFFILKMSLAHCYF